MGVAGDPDLGAVRSLSPLSMHVPAYDESRSREKDVVSSGARTMSEAARNRERIALNGRCSAGLASGSAHSRG